MIVIWNIDKLVDNNEVVAIKVVEEVPVLAGEEDKKVAVDLVEVTMVVSSLHQ